MLVRANNTKGEWAYFDPERVELVEQDEYQEGEINIFLQDSALSVSKNEWNRLAPIIGITLPPEIKHDIEVFETERTDNLLDPMYQAKCKTCGKESSWLKSKDEAIEYFKRHECL